MDEQPAIFTAKSDANWALGLACLRKDEVDSAANRLYYALFQAVKCYGLRKGLWEEHAPEGEVGGKKRSVHIQAQELAGKVSPAQGKFYRAQYTLLKGHRVKADYLPAHVARTDLEHLLIEADKMRKFFLSTIEA